MTDQTARHNGCFEMERRSHLEATRVDPLWLQKYLQAITAMHRAPEVGLAMHHWQGHRWPLLLPAAARKDRAGSNAVTLEAFFPTLMAPAQQLMEVHHPGGIGIAEMHEAFQLEPVVWRGHGNRRRMVQGKAGNPRMPSTPNP